MDTDLSTETARVQYGRQAARYTASASHAGGADLARLLELLAPDGHEDMLDVATGTGHTALAFAPHVHGVTGADPTPEMLEEAEKLAAERAITNVAWIRAQAERLPFADATFDIVTVRRAPHHFRDIPLALAEMHRVLRPGGKLGLVDQLSARIPDGVVLMERFEKLRDPSHVRALSVDEWRAALDQAGFAVRHLEVDRERTTLRRYFEIAGTPEANRERIAVLFGAADPGALASFGYEAEPAPEGSFLKERVVVYATCA